jgi:hypothetical protein
VWLDSLKSITSTVLAERSPAAPRATSTSACSLSLAAGADQLIARAALDRGFRLDVPLPFHREAYERGFTVEESLLGFRAMLQQATSVLELDGGADDKPAAYLAAGRVLLDHSEIIVAVSDGAPEEFVGGTAHLLRLARERGTPILKIPTDDPRTVVIQLDEFNQQAIGRDGLDQNVMLRKIVARLLGGPWRDEDTPGTGWKILDATWQAFQRTMTPDSNWPPSFVDVDVPVDPLINDLSQSATTLMARHRGAVVLNYLLCAIAVLFAAVANFLASDRVRNTLLVAEAGCLLLAVLFHWVSIRRKWYSQAVDLRFLVEHLRVHEIVHRLALRFPRVDVSVLDPADTQHASTVESRLQAFVRARGLPSVTVTPDTIRQYLRWLEHDVVSAQIRYHENNARACRVTEHRLTHGAWLLLGLSLLACVVHLLNGVESTAGADLTPVFVVLSVAAPAFGAGLHGIAAHLEFHPDRPNAAK